MARSPYARVSDVQDGFKEMADKIKALPVGGDMVKAQNLADLPNKAAARGNLDVYSTSEVDTAIAAGGSGSGTGDVVGPATSVTNHLAQFADTTGKLLKDGPALGVASAGSVPTRGDADARYLLASLLGLANGVMPLGADGKASTAFLPDAVLGALKWQGVWDAATNTPTIPAAAAGNKGWYFVVNVAGATSVSGITDWEIGDWLVSNGAAWEKIDNTDQVVSVAGLKGIITIASLLTALGAGAANGLATLNSSSNVPSTQLNTASAATIRAGTSTTTIVPTKNLTDAYIPQALTDAATIAVDMEAGWTFSVTLAGNRTLGNPTNVKTGRWGFISVKQDATGGRVLTPAANWNVKGPLRIDPAPNAETVLAFFPVSATLIHLVSPFNPNDAINVQTGTTYTLAASDNGGVVELVNASAITLTLPNNLPVGFNCVVCQGGAGAFTRALGSGATLRNRSSHTKSAGQWAEISLRVRSNVGGTAAEWVMSGDTAA